ncbi:MAG TPA: ferrochelatase [Alphaproteobacteria bacterium]|nr:ferrochelatase [Alphaproteobacteria bacterium]
MRTAVLYLGFGEPEEPTPDAVIPFLERIFAQNAPLEAPATADERARRARELAERRAPGLIEDYERIGGSPLGAQARGQADALRRRLAERGHVVDVRVAMQYVDPLIPDVVAGLQEGGIERLIGLPVYPLCGWSTNVAALAEMREAVEALGWDVEVHEVNGWHSHPVYVQVWADAIERTASEDGLDLRAPDTELYFSAHGTPIKYLEAGSRYDLYVEEFCRETARRLGVDSYALGYQNHANRGVRWTQPDNEERIREVAANHVVVAPISFMHEQSETLAELDIDFREEAEGLGLAFHRVPVPNSDPRFADVLADLVVPFIEGRGAAEAGFAPCLCRRAPGAVCLNATRAFPRRAAPAPVAG